MRFRRSRRPIRRRRSSRPRRMRRRSGVGPMRIGYRF